MATPFIGEIRAFPYNFAPLGWASCNGQLLPIAQNTALFSIIGTLYGGNGTSNFALPNLQGSVAVGMGQGPGLGNYPEGQAGGEASHLLTVTEMPGHTHQVSVSSGAATSPAGAGLAIGTPTTSAFGPAVNLTAMGGAVGGGIEHNNLQPYLTFNFCIAVQGIFPSRA